MLELPGSDGEKNVSVQRILTGLEDRYERETDLRLKMRLAEKCADTYSRLKRNQLSKTFYLKQVHRHSSLSNRDRDAALSS